MVRSGILYVASRMGWYISLARLISAAGSDSPAFTGGSESETHDLESRIVDLYHSVLSFEIGVACSYKEFGDHSKYRDTGRILEVESALAKSFGGAQIESLLLQLAKLTQERRDTLGETGKGSDGGGNSGGNSEDESDGESGVQNYGRENTREEEEQEMMAGLAAPQPEAAVPFPGDAEGRILKPLYNGIIAPRQEYRDFLDAACEAERDQGRLLWIKGAAGAGKTMLMHAIVERLSQRPEPLKASLNTTNSNSPGRLSYFFCGNSERGPEDAISILRSLLWQVLDAQPFSRRYLVEKGRSIKRKQFNGPNDFYAMAEVLASIVEDDKFTTTFFAIDAIDDLDDDASGLCELLGLMAATAKMQPTKVRWLVSTTSDTWGDRLLSDRLAVPGAPLALQLNLDKQAEGLEVAFSKYISSKIDELAKPAYHGEFRHKITNVLRARSNLNFLWVSLACKIIESTGTPWNALNTVEKLPAKIEALYKHARDEIATRPWDSDHCNRVLDTAAVACRPLDIQELRDLQDLPSEVDLNILVDKICYPFLKIRNNTVYLTHQYAKRVLREHLGQRISSTHAKMAEICLGKAFVGMSSPVSTRYAAIYWARHLANVCDSDDRGHDDGSRTGPGYEAMKAAVNFLERHSLQWVETLASANLVCEALVELESLERALRVRDLTPAPVPISIY